MAEKNGTQKELKTATDRGAAGSTPVLTSGSKGPPVFDLQNKLREAGYDIEPADGIYGPETMEAVRQFQLDFGLPADGAFGPQTARQLDQFLSIDDPAQPLPEPVGTDGKPLLMGIFRFIGAQRDPLAKLHRLVQMMERAQTYEDREAGEQVRHFALREASQMLMDERWRQTVLESEGLKILLDRFGAQEDQRAGELEKLIREAQLRSEETAEVETPTDGSREDEGTETLPVFAKATPKIATDIWNREDQLGYAAFARALAALITHKETVPPLTIGIKAPWGAGKTSLMRMIQALLDGRPEHTGMSGPYRSPDPARDPGSMAVDGDWQPGVQFKEFFKTLKDPGIPIARVRPEASDAGKASKIEPRVTVWFNAWKYQSSEQIWAGLAHCIVSQVTSRLAPLERERFWLKLHARRVDVNKIRQSFYQLVFNEFLPRAVLWASGAMIALAAGIVLPKALSLIGFVGSAGLLQGLVSDWKKRLSDRMNGSVAGMFRDFIRSPSYEGKLGFLHLVESDLREVLKLVASPEQPLVVFIDDLDRCAPPQVAQVVEAINLFLAGDYPDCIFVLGMEPEMVAAALDASYKTMDEILKKTSADNDLAPLGWRFMEKIIQLPLSIPALTPANVDNYLQALLKGAGDAPEAPVQVPEQAVAEAEAGLDQAKDIAEVEQFTQEKLKQAKNEDEVAVLREAGKRVFARKLAARDPMVQAFVRESAAWFNANPRQIKRYINLFRFYATLRYAYQLDGYYDDPEATIPTDAALAKFVALSIRWPQAIGWLWTKDGHGGSHLAHLEKKARQLAENAGTKKKVDSDWEAYLQQCHLALDWAMDSEFRTFLATGEALADYHGCWLW